MCYPFTIAFKSYLQSSKSKSASQTKTKSICALEVSRPYGYSPIHARVDTIMGVLPNKRASEGTAAITERTESHYYSVLKDIMEEDNLMTESTQKPKNGYDSAINNMSGQRSPNDLDDAARSRATISHQQFRSRPYLYERRNYPSSPLANIGMLERLKAVLRY